MSKTEILIVTHKENVNIPDNPLLQPIQVGTALSPYRIPNIAHDDEGENISAKNKSYCELTALYWMWKNVKADNYGLFHYRRYFNFSSTPLPITNEPFVFNEVVFSENNASVLRQIHLNSQDMQRTIDSCDFIAPVAYPSPSNETVYEQYRGSVGHHIEDLDAVIDIINSQFPEYAESAKTYLENKMIYCCNMFVMKSELFDRYCSFVFGVLERFEQAKDISEYPPVDMRVHGYLAERITGIFFTYLYGQGYHGKELQRVYFRKTETSPYVGLDGNAGHINGGIRTQLSLRQICRGTGTILCKLRVNNPPKDYLPIFYVKYDEKTGKQSMLSTFKLLERKNGMDTWLISLPAISVNLFLTVKICDEHRNVIASLNKKISQPSAALLSKASHFINKNEANRIRSIADAAPTGNLKFEIICAAPDTSGGCTLHFSITEEFVGAASSESYQIDLLDAHCSSLPTDNLMVLKDKVRAHDEYPHCQTREVQYSAHLTAQPANIFIIATRNVASSFCVYRNDMTQSLLDDWRKKSTGSSSFVEYHDWFLAKQRIGEKEAAMQRLAVFDYQPKFSIVVPLYKTPLIFLEEMISSVQSQTYRNWELILVNASPEDEALRDATKECVQKDKRIANIVLEENLGITENTNHGIDAATGNYICFLDHDDVLEPNVLFEYARAIEKHHDTDLLYCDEDKLMGDRYCDPYFKPDFNPDLLHGINYVCHFLAVSRRVIERMDKPTSIYDGAQDHNMTFWAAETGGHVAHIAKVMYHWRIHENSTASSPDEKPYTQEAARLCVEHHLQRTGINAHAIDSVRVPRHYELVYDLPTPLPLISIVIPNKNSKPVLQRCVESILSKSTYANYEIVIVDNQSDDAETLAYYEELQCDHANIRVTYYPEPFNFSAEVNLGVENSRGEYVVLLNNDTEIITEDWLEKMLGPCTRPEMGAVGAKLLFPDDTVQHAGVAITEAGPAHINYMIHRSCPGYYDTARLSMDLSAVTAACIMCRKSVYQNVGGFDTAFLVNYNDVDFCLKVRKAGLLVLFEAGVEVYHHESISRGSNEHGEMRKRFFCEKALMMERWPEYYGEGDPYYNKNFQDCYFSIE